MRQIVISSVLLASVFAFAETEQTYQFTAELHGYPLAAVLRLNTSTGTWTIEFTDRDTENTIGAPRPVQMTFSGVYTDENEYRTFMTEYANAKIVFRVDEQGRLIFHTANVHFNMEKTPISPIHD